MTRVKDTTIVDDKTFRIVLSEPYGLVIDSLSTISTSLCYMMRKKDAETDPNQQIRETIGSAIHLIVQQSRLRGGVRRIVSVAEVIGIKDGEVQFQELYNFKQVGVNAEGKAVGYHSATGILPMRLEHFRAEGEDVSEQLFSPSKQPSPDKLY